MSKIERIGHTTLIVRLPTDCANLTDSDFNNRFWKSISTELDSYLKYCILESCKTGLIDNEEKSYEYKISITVEKSKMFDVFFGEYTE